MIEFVDLYDSNRKFLMILLSNRFNGNRLLSILKYTELYSWNDSIVKQYRQVNYIQNFVCEMLEISDEEGERS